MGVPAFVMLVFFFLFVLVFPQSAGFLVLFFLFVLLRFLFVDGGVDMLVLFSIMAIRRCLELPVSHPVVRSFRGPPGRGVPTGGIS